VASFYSDQGLLSKELSQYRVRRTDGEHEKAGHSPPEEIWFKGENFADSEDTDPRRSDPGVFSIDGDSIPLSIVETFSINQRLCGMI
jgi:hypothetical protein